ncbi:hypothetical protein [uncultured Tessaracoccus sp.]|uniref:hypothetical protein n=1 Tax=uncultured Tessaracoccus sp. TaxID=905023 RepID=UPI002636B30B|nr:hypothetical protein [uncultured Tessaracoccus sp.]
MTRQLKSWARSHKPRRGPKITLFSDLATMGFRRQAPQTSQPRRTGNNLRLARDYARRIRVLAALWPRFDVEVVGGDALVGLETPFVLAVNEAGTLDQQVLALALPRALRPTTRRPSHALSKGRNVVVFSGEPIGERLVGEFDVTAAELAKQHSIAIVPVGLVGSFRLADTLKLRLRNKPKVSVRFGAPVHVATRSIDDVTDEVQARVEHLVGEGELSWWDVERRRTSGDAPASPRAAKWRRLWDQAEPRNDGARRRIWR